MKKIIFLSVLVAAVFTSCQSNDPNGSNSNGSNNLSTGQIEMKVYPDNNNNVSFSAMTQKLTIDWGDGTVDNLTPNGVGKSFPHVYSNQNLQTVKVTTSGMTGTLNDVSYNYGFALDGSASFQELKFGNCPELISILCGEDQLSVLEIGKCPALTYLDCSYGQLTALDVSKCTSLTTLYCGDAYGGCGNQLTSLDVSKCTALTELDCSYNQLSASALNALFNSLPTRKSTDNATITIYENPGENTCDRTIATKKGWTVSF